MTAREQRSVGSSAKGDLVTVDSKLTRHVEPGLSRVSVDQLAYSEHHLGLRCLPGETTSETARRLAATLLRLGAAVVRHEVFGGLAMKNEFMHALERELGSVDWPITWVAGAEGISGMHILALAGLRVESVRLDGRPVGRVFDDGSARHCVLGELMALRSNLPREAQYANAFEMIEHALEQAGMTPRDLVRTWFFIEDIASGYSSFNAVRTRFYREWQILDGMLPASTGVGAQNPAGGAVLAGAWALKATSGGVSVSMVPSPLQCSAFEYGSAFSRAILVEDPNGRHLSVSGTAGIDAKGSSDTGGFGKQLELTLKVVESILTANGFTFHDVTRATAYFNDLSDEPSFRLWLRERNLEFLGVIPTQAELCRPELQFEIELDAINKTAHLCSA